MNNIQSHLNSLNNDKTTVMTKLYDIVEVSIDVHKE